MQIKPFIETNGRPPRACIFLSGSGTNAEKLLESLKNGLKNSWQPALLFTDAPTKSRAFEIGKNFGIPVESLDIKEFYLRHGENRVSIATERGQFIRELWTCEIRKIIAPYKVDFGILAGFVPLTNIIKDFPCLNVHPGDLTIEENGKRLLVGLHTIPIETAILKGFATMRSSVILAQPYSGAGGEMDSGPILGISEEIPIDMLGFRIEELKKIVAERPPVKPLKGYCDKLEELAKHNQEILKRKGDWVVFPRVVADFAAANFAANEKGGLLYNFNGSWQSVKTVEYSQTNIRLIF